jgi:hypothetical protein
VAISLFAKPLGAPKTRDITGRTAYRAVTREFRRGQTITAGRIVERLPGSTRHRWTEYLMLRARVRSQLGVFPLRSDRGKTRYRSVHTRDIDRADYHREPSRGPCTRRAAVGTAGRRKVRWAISFAA